MTEETKDLIIKDTVRDNIVEWLDNTNLPHKDVTTIISALESLEEANAEEVVEENE